MNTGSVPLTYLEALQMMERPQNIELSCPKTLNFLRWYSQQHQKNVRMEE